MSKILPGLLLVSTLMGIPARAQMLNNPVQDYINKTNLLNNILSNRRATDMSQKAQTKGKSANPDTGRAASRAASAAVPEPTRFTHAGGALLPPLLAGKSGVAAAERLEAERFFVSLLKLYEQTARKDGFAANDLAYAFEYFVVNSYLTYHDLHDVDYNKDPRVKRGKDMFDRLTIINEKKLLKVTLSQERAVYQQFKTLLAENPEVRAMTDRQKQELSELLAIMFGVQYTAYMKGINSEDEKGIEQARRMAKEYLEKLIGVPVERIKIDNNGLRR
jgi:hypothetical protein